MNALSDDQIARLVPAVLGDARSAGESVAQTFLSESASPEPIRVRRLTGGVANHVYCVDDRYTVRIGTGADGACFPQSAAVMGAAAALSVRCPRLLYTDFSKARYPYNIMVCAWIPGVMLAEVWPSLTREQKRSSIREIASELQRIHQIPPDRIESFAGLPPWRERFMAKIEQHLAHAYAHTPFPRDRLDNMRKRVAECSWALACAGPDVVIHNDAHLHNTIVADGRVTGLLDFDDTELAPAENDLRYTLYRVIEADNSLSEPEVCQWIADIFPDYAGAPGRRERDMLSGIGDILGDLAGVLYWFTPEEQLAEVTESYRRLFGKE